MPAYSFKPRFVPLIERGEKEHTIRAYRARRTVPGDLLSLYTGMRTKHCRLLMRRHCTKAPDIVIVSSGKYFALGTSVFVPQIEVDGVKLVRDEMDALAVRDGFFDLREMASFWDLSEPFRGQIVHWRFAEVSA